MAATESLLQEMLDEFALRKLVHAYCRAVDRGDFATLRELYHHDAVDAHGEISTGSVDEFLKTLEASRPHIRSMQHHITTVNFAIDDNTAEG
jgi:SnoaL-like domain